ncbi:MAG: GAF domain-containing sensor histidine kinase [Leeuwenhoekiella sp.]
MIYPAKAEDETGRLMALQELEILDSQPEASYDSITKLASFICNVPVALITLINEDQQWFKSKVGFDICGTDRDVSFCAHAILNPSEFLEVKDSTKDERFKDNPLTKTGNIPVIFYAGVPLLSHNGQPLGSLCVIDSKPNSLTPEQKDALKHLALQVENLFELRRSNLNLNKAHKQLQSKNTQLSKFAGTVSHDMKMPLANMIITADILKKKYSSSLDDKGKEYLHYLKQASFTLSEYITNLLAYYESENLVIDNVEEFDLNSLVEDLIDLLNINHECEIHIPDTEMTITSNRSAINKILLNLITNSLKYNDKPEPLIKIITSQDENFYYIAVKDNGMGIPQDKHENIFKLFTTANAKDINGKKGNGIGLSTVRNLVTSLGGTIEVTSDIDKGATFKFSVKKALH